MAAAPVPASAAPSPFDPAQCGLNRPQGAPPNAWQVDRLQLDRVHRIATGRGIRIAVIDTGVSPLHSRYFPGPLTEVNFAAPRTRPARSAGPGSTATTGRW